MLERWTRVVIRFRFFVLACWLAIAVVGAVSAVRLPPLLTTSLAVPGTSSEQADTILARHFAQNPDGTFTVVLRAPARTEHRLARQIAAAARALPHAHTTSLQSGAGIVYGDVATGLDLQRAADETDILRHALRGQGLSTAYITGAPAIQHDLNPILAADLRKGETIAVPVALLMLALVLGLRPVLLIPLIFATCTITAALAIVYIMAHAFLMVTYVPNLVELIGLGLAIDYSLLFVHRFREEVVNQSGSVDDAIVRTMATAGRAVFFSGAAVAIGLSAVLIMPVPFIRSLGVAGVVVPLVSIVAALTVQPALLSLLGRWGVRGIRLPSFGRVRGVERRAWARLARTVMHRPLTVLAGTAVLLAVLAAPVLWLQLTPGSLSGFPSFTESARGLALLRDRVGPGAITPIDVVFDGGAPGRARTPATSTATLRLGRRLLQDPEVFVVAIGTRAPYVDASGRYGRMVVVGRHEFGDEATQQLVRRLRRQLIPANHFPAGFHVSTGGAPAQGVDFLGQVYGSFPWIVLAVLALAYVVLLRAFRSLLLPVLALLLDVASVAASYGMLVLVFRFDIGADLIGLYRAPQVEGWIPVFLFATLFGLSMDYQVFLVTRMREAWDRGVG
ncbi:MAG TPA: MMPL family transporter, partial [Chloroflexota bacterium]